MLRFEGRAPVDSRQIIDTRVIREAPFPEDPQARFEAIFAAIGNSEAKCATLLSLPSNHPLTAFELHTVFLDSTDRAWETNPRIQAEYCDATFIPIGFVAKAEILYFGKMNFVKGYRITEAGIKYGQPIAKFLLERSSHLPYSLDTLFGPTGRGGGGTTRGVLNRASILEKLYEKGSDSSAYTTNATVYKELGLNRALPANHMRALQDLGLVEYSSVNTEHPGQVHYTFVSDGESQAQSVRNWPTLTSVIYEVMEEIETGDIATVIEECKKRLPNITVTNLRASQVLSGLVNQGLLSSDFRSGRGNTVFSKARITQAGKQIVEEIIMPIKNSLTPEGQGKLEEWNRLPWQLYAPQAVEKYASSSSGANSRPVQEWASDALQIILDNPGIRMTEIGARLKTNIQIVLKILMDEGVVRKEKMGKATRYYPIDYLREASA